MVDDIRDIRITKDLDIELDNSNDIAVTKPENTPLQSVFIHVKNIITRFLGENLTPTTKSRLGGEIADVVNTDPQIDEVRFVRVQEGTDSDTVDIKVGYTFNQEFEVAEISSAV